MSGQRGGGGDGGVPSVPNRATKDQRRYLLVRLHALTELVQEVPISMTTWAKIHSKNAVSQDNFFPSPSQLPASDGRRVECSPSCHHVVHMYQCLQLQAKAGWVGEIVPPTPNI